MLNSTGVRNISILTIIGKLLQRIAKAISRGMYSKIYEKKLAEIKT